MNKKSRVLYLLIALMMVFSVSAFAAGIGDKNDDKASGKFIRVWDENYYFQKHVAGQHMWLFDIKPENIGDS